MDTTTVRESDSILAKGYYRKGTTLGSGGWGYLYKNGANEWKEYHLYIYSDSNDGSEAVDTVFAKDDNTARSAFYELFHLDKCEYSILRHEHILTDVTTAE